MILVTKGTEPASLVTYRRSEGASYDCIDSNCKAEVRRQLLEEQKSLCAYCMSKISESNMKIEHYIPRHGFEGDLTKQLEYRNLLAVCKGGEGKGYKTCDTMKGNQLLLRTNPQQESTISTIGYKKDGTICSTDTAIKDELNRVLNLNHVFLKGNRADALKSFKEYVQKNSKNKTCKATTWLSLKRSVSESDTPYKGIILAYINRKLAR